VDLLPAKPPFAKTLRSWWPLMETFGWSSFRLTHSINVHNGLLIAVDKAKVIIEEYNFDHPHALDFDMAYKVLDDLLKGQKTSLPKYCFVTHSRLKET
jgi:hypothetical protein